MPQEKTILVWRQTLYCGQFALTFVEVFHLGILANCVKSMAKECKWLQQWVIIHATAKAIINWSPPKYSFGIASTIISTARNAMQLTRILLTAQSVSYRTVQVINTQQRTSDKTCTKFELDYCYVEVKIPHGKYNVIVIKSTAVYVYLVDY